jgi:hypothetical protein
LLAYRVSSDDMKVRAGSEILVSDARRDYDHVARLHMGADSHCVSETDHCIAAIDAQHLVCGAVIVSERVDAIPPRGPPIVPGVEILEGIRQRLAASRDRGLKDQQRQARIVGYIARVCEEVLFGRAHKKILPTDLLLCNPKNDAIDLCLSIVRREVRGFLLIAERIEPTMRRADNLIEGAM